MQKSLVAKKKKRRVPRQGKSDAEFQQAKQSSYADDANEGSQEQVHDQTGGPQLHQIKNEQHMPPGQNQTVNADDQTTGQNVDSSLPQPYQFLRFARPPLHTIFIPHFTVKSINFALSIIFILAFIGLVIFNYIKPQNDFTWNCTLFQLQNKYFPRIRYDYQFWRVPISGIFHSNYPHFFLNLFGLQIYGYFIEWYYGKIKYLITIIFAVIFSHFLGCLAEMNKISTCTSAILFSILTLKLFFFYEYWSYKPLMGRKIFLFILFGLVFCINLIPIFISNNVDFSSYIGGFITGLLLGFVYYIRKQQSKLQGEQTIPLYQKVIKFSAPILLGVFIIVCVSIIFVVGDANTEAVNNSISEKCSF